MNFSKADIEGMLRSYEDDCQAGMDISLISGLLYDYTAGYPFLVSRLCKIMDENPNTSMWNRDGFQVALQHLLSESNTLFDDMRKKISDNPDMKRMLYGLLYEGQSFPYNIDDNVLDVAQMFGYIRNDHGKVVITNRIFETRLYNLFISEERMQSAIYTEGSKDRNLFIQNGRLDMRREIIISSHRHGTRRVQT